MRHRPDLAGCRHSSCTAPFVASNAGRSLELYYWQGLTAEELGRILAEPEDGPDGIPAGTIRRRIHDAKARLRTCLETGVAAAAPGQEREPADVEDDLRALGRLLVSGPSGV